jgi:hypothetical protein
MVELVLRVEGGDQLGHVVERHHGSFPGTGLVGHQARRRREHALVGLFPPPQEVVGEHVALGRPPCGSPCRGHGRLAVLLEDAQVLLRRPAGATRERAELLELAVAEDGPARLVERHQSDVHAVDHGVEQPFTAGTVLEEHLKCAVLLLEHRLLRHHARGHHADRHADGEHDERQQEGLREGLGVDLGVGHEHRHPYDAQRAQETGGEGGAREQAGGGEPDDREHGEKPHAGDDGPRAVAHEADGDEVEQRDDQEGRVREAVPRYGDAQRQQYGLQAHADEEGLAREEVAVEQEAARQDQQHRE